MFNNIVVNNKTIVKYYNSEIATIHRHTYCNTHVSTYNAATCGGVDPYSVTASTLQ